MADVRLTKVAKRFGAVSVIVDLDLDIRDQEFMVLVGPSGCGKSTLLRMIAGLEETSSGTIAIGGRVVNDAAPKDRDIAMVFQNYALYPHMTVRENLEFGLRIRKLPRDEIRRLVDEASSILGLADLLDRKPKQLSGGQRQRVAVGRAIVRKPAVFLFDEPLSNLDAKLRVQMRAEITRLQARLHTTCVYVTHDQVEAMTMGHRIAVMRDGHIDQVGTPLDVYDRPETRFVAQFIGTPPMNFVGAVVRDGGSVLAAEGFTLNVPEGSRGSALRKLDGAPVHVGIRPENIRLVENPPLPGTGLTTEVEVVEPLGHEVVVHSRLGEDRIVAKADMHGRPALGDWIHLAVDVSSLHLFDVRTGRRLSTD
jgi:multiple sugar transport system ATP-binding protein